VGLRSLSDGPTVATKHSKTALPSFKQFRGADGKFYFKLVDAQGVLLLESTGFEQPKAAALTIGSLQQLGTPGLEAHQAQLIPKADAQTIGAALAALAKR
jgi:tryptophanyl-tRNA synthetase